MIITADKGFTGRISVLVGSSMKSRAKTNYLVPYVEQDVEGQGLELDISEEDNPRPDLFPQGFGSDQGIYTFAHIMFTVYTLIYRNRKHRERCLRVLSCNHRSGVVLHRGGRKGLQAGRRRRFLCRYTPFIWTQRLWFSLGRVSR